MGRDRNISLHNTNFNVTAKHREYKEPSFEGSYNFRGGLEKSLDDFTLPYLQVYAFQPSGVTPPFSG